ncbi:MAG: Cthe_2314 family HEPN domain-containing protein [Saprospiraceae bacterium]
MYDSRLARNILEATNEASDEATKAEGYNIMKNNYHLLSERGKYVMGVFRYYNRILSVAEDLDKVQVFLRRFPNTKYLKENGINQLSYTQYHIEVAIHKVHTILELKKLMINEVFELGLSERDCSWDLIKDKPEIKGGKIYGILNSYYTTFKQMINARHLNTHRGIFKDSEKDNLEVKVSIYEGFEKYDIEIDDEMKRAIPKFILDWKVKEFRKGKINLVIESKKIIEVYVKTFFDEINTEFEKRRKEKTRHNKV